MKKADYLSLDPPYPKTAFVCLFFAFADGNPKYLFPMDKIYTSIDVLMPDLKIYAKEFVKLNKECIVPERILLLPITFEKRYLLKKEHWENPTEDYNSYDKLRSFIKVINSKILGKKLLVTPSGHDVKKDSWIFNSTLPFLENEEKIIEKFMLSSRVPVNESAKYAAIYNLGEVMTFDWKKNEFIKIEQKNNFSDKN